MSAVRFGTVSKDAWEAYCRRAYSDKRQEVGRSILTRAEVAEVSAFLAKKKCAMKGNAPSR